MTDSSEDIGGLHRQRFAIRRDAIDRAPLGAIATPIAGSVTSLLPPEVVQALGEGPAHADPRHPLHHLWVDAEDWTRPQTYYDNVERQRMPVPRNGLTFDVVRHEEPRRSFLDHILGGLI